MNTRTRTRTKKKANARILTIRTQWAKVSRLDYVGTDRFFDDILWDYVKRNPNKSCGFYIPTDPNDSPSITKLNNDIPTYEYFDDDEIAYFTSLLNDDTICLLDDEEVFA